MSKSFMQNRPLLGPHVLSQLDQDNYSNATWANQCKLQLATEHHSSFLLNLRLADNALLFRRPLKGKSVPDAEAIIKVWDCNHSSEPVHRVPDVYDAASANATGIEDAKAAFENSQLVFRYYLEIFKRNSLDNAGMPLLNMVRYRQYPGQAYVNAFWDGTAMHYGDGGKFAHALDVVGHEMSHGVVTFVNELKYMGQSGALNESFADAMGLSLVYQVKNTKVKDADWQLGLHVIPETGDQPLRNMKDPHDAYTPQPDRMSEYEHYPLTPMGDNGGVHINSGIPNHAFYLIADRLADLDPTKYAYAHDEGGAAHIFFNGLANLDGDRRPSFEKFAKATIQATDNQDHMDLIAKVWRELEVIE